MAKQNLLTIVQGILSGLNSDNVNSITDTREAYQVAVECQRVFYNIVNSKIYPSMSTIIQLDSSVDISKPNYLTLKEQVIHMDEIRYDIRDSYDNPPDYRLVQYLPYREFLDLVMSRNPSNSDVQVVMDYKGTPLFIYNNVAPTYFTCFDDTHIVFDSYNAAVDTTLQASKTQAFSTVEPKFELRNDYIPELPSKLFSYYTTECLAWCFVMIKEMANEKVELSVAEQKAWVSRRKHRVQGGIQFPNYGRRGRVGGTGNDFNHDK